MNARLNNPQASESRSVFANSVHNAEALKNPHKYDPEALLSFLRSTKENRRQMQ